MSNLACRIFKEQLDLLLSLPNQEEAKTVLYKAVINSFNQFEYQNENQIENQNENAYVSVSVSLSELSKSILNLLSKNIVWKEFSNNYGGKRERAGRPKTVIVKEEPYKESFEEFWNLFPKKRAGSKQKAYKSYCQAIKENRTTESDILEAVKAYSESDEVKRGFAKGCAAWINDDRFNNQYKVQEWTI